MENKKSIRSYAPFWLWHMPAALRSFCVFVRSDDAPDNESAVYQPRDAWDACFCPRCNVKSPRLVLVLGGAS